MLGQNGPPQYMGLGTQLKGWAIYPHADHHAKLEMYLRVNHTGGVWMVS